MNKKGMSSLIATVLIIGFTIVLAVLVINFVQNIFEDRMDATGCDAAGYNICLSATNYDIVATYNVTADETTTNIINMNSQAMDFAVIFYGAAGQSLSVNSSVGIVAGYTAIDVIYEGNATTVKIIPSAIGEYEDLECAAVTCDEKEVDVATV
jgi:flagellin-like protein